MKAIANYESAAKEIVNWTREAVESNGTKDAIIILNGDRDSAIVANILIKALGEDHVLGLIMPFEPSMDCSKTYMIARQVGMKKLKEVDITLTTQAAECTTKIACDNEDILWVTSADIIPRTRTLLAQTIASQINAVVISTLNLSDYTIGNFTLWSNVGMLAPLGKLTSTEVAELGKALGLPDEIVEMQQYEDAYGQTSESKIGFKYADLDMWIRGGDDIPEGIKKVIEDRFSKCSHKCKLINMPAFHPAIVQ